MGSLPEVAADALGFFQEARRRYGDLVTLRFGPYDHTFVTHPDALQRLLKDNVKNYTKDSPFYSTMRLALGDGLVTSDGEVWEQQRQNAQPFFVRHRERIDGWARVMTEEGVRLADRLSEPAARDTPIDLGAELVRASLAVVRRTLLGAKSDAECQEVPEAVAEIQRQLNQRIMGFSWPMVFPTPRNRRLTSALQALDRAVLELIAARRAKPGADMLSFLIAAQEQGASAVPLRDQVMTLFLAGHETVANTLGWAIYLLAQHPNKQDRLQAELDQTLAGDCPTADTALRLTFARQVIEETMRLYPALWILERRAQREDELSGFHVPARRVVFWSPYVTHRHEDFFPEPERFDPQRFAPEQAHGRHPFAFIPFGAGPRTCIGRSFAMLEMSIILACLCARYTFSLAPGARVESEALVTLKPKGLFVLARPRPLVPAVAHSSDRQT